MAINAKMEDLLPMMKMGFANVIAILPRIGENTARLSA